MSRPAFEMTGFFEYYPAERLQLIGKTEMAYFLSLSKEEQIDRIEKMCTDITPGIIVSRGMEIPEVIIETANRKNVPVLQSKYKTTRDRKSTRLNSSHVAISYAVFCLKKKKNTKNILHES